MRPGFDPKELQNNPLFKRASVVAQQNTQAELVDDDKQKIDELKLKIQEEIKEMNLVMSGRSKNQSIANIAAMVASNNITNQDIQDLITEYTTSGKGDEANLIYPIQMAFWFQKEFDKTPQDAAYLMAQLGNAESRTATYRLLNFKNQDGRYESVVKDLYAIEVVDYLFSRLQTYVTIMGNYSGDEQLAKVKEQISSDIGVGVESYYPSIAKNISEKFDVYVQQYVIQIPQGFDLKQAMLETLGHNLSPKSSPQKLSAQGHEPAVKPQVQEK
jgi:hypothetical protein